MMNQYRDRFGRVGSRMGGCGDASPYRRPQSREGMLRQSFNRSGGCGCGLVSGQGQSRYPENATPHAPVCQVPTPIPERPNCGCGGSVSVNCKKLMEQIRAVDFALYETVLYLDVYPHSCDALETYRKLKAQSEALHKEYETTHAPLTAFGNESETSWDWMSKPFPWEYDAD